MSGFNLQYFPKEALSLTISSEAADFIAKDKSLHLLNPSGAIMNIQLPAPASGIYITLKDISGLLNTKTVNIIRNGTELIDGQAANLVLTSNYQSTVLISNGIDWFII